MKECTSFEALLDLFVDGELSPEEMARVQSHLDQCPACRAYVDDALAIRAALDGWEKTPVPEDFHARYAAHAKTYHFALGVKARRCHSGPAPAHAAFERSPADPRFR